MSEGSTEVAHLLLRAELDGAEIKGMCGVCLFVDIVTAYAAFMRSLVVDDEVSEVILRQKLLAMGIDCELVRGVVDEMMHLWVLGRGWCI